MAATLDLAIELINRPSVTPEDGGCQTLMCERLKKLGFGIEPLPFEDVSNFWARRGDSGPLFVFAGHTDVVPPGPNTSWDSDPFRAEIRDGYLYGRGAADMKGSLAAMVTAVEHFIAEHPDHAGSLGFLVTSDEEGPSINGTRRVIEHLEARNEKIDWCLVGEPSSTHHVGDVIKNGRRGSLAGLLTVNGVQGHIAYPHLADNPVHSAAPALADLIAEHWDDGNEFFPPTSFQISNIQAGTGADNVIPGTLEVMFNFRFSPQVTDTILQTRTEAILNRYDLDYTLNWHLSGKPFMTPPDGLVQATVDAIAEETGITADLSTSGGTSDGRFIAPTGAQVIELGPVNATIHKVNECVRVEDLERLSRIYGRILHELLIVTS